MSDNLYDNIDYCLEILYESIYANKTDECYSINSINKKDIVIDDIRKDKDFNFSEVLTGNIKKMGIYNNRLHYKKENSGNSYTIAIGFTNKKYNLNDLLRPELYNMAMMYMGSEVVFEEKFNHILLPIMCFDIEKDKLEKIISTLQDDFDKLYEKDNNNMYVIVTEHFFKMMTLKEYLDKNIETITVYDIKNIIFQIFITLIKLSERFNKFRHNNLNLDSIRLYFKEKSDDIIKISGMTYKIKNNNIEVKITDFDNSYHQGEYIKNNNNDILLNNLNTDNPYYDIHYIINSIYLYLKYNEKDNSQKLLKYFTDFFNEIIPEKYRIEDYKKFKGLDQDKYNKNQDIIFTALTIIKKNNIFKDFNIDNIENTNEINQNRVSSLKMKESGIKYIESGFLNNLYKIKNKKSNQYYSTMIKGSRKINLPELSEASNALSFSSMSGGKPKKSSKKSKSKKIESSTSFNMSDSISNNRSINPHLTSISSITQSGGKSSSSKSSSSSASSASSTPKESRSRSSKKQNRTYGHHKLENLPDGYFDLAPEHLVHSMQNQMPQEGQMPTQQMPEQYMPQEGQMLVNQGMNMPQQMPQEMPQEMAMNPAMMNPSMMNPAMMNPAMMNPGMMNMGQMHGQLGVPMMNNPMANFMGMQPQQMQTGGGKKLQKYKLTNQFFF